MIKIYEKKDIENGEIFLRTQQSVNVGEIVSEIIKNVKENGDKALFEYCEKFDDSRLDSLEVSENEIDEAVKKVGEEFLEVLREAAENIRS